MIKRNLNLCFHELVPANKSQWVFPRLYRNLPAVITNARAMNLHNQKCVQALLGIAMSLIFFDFNAVSFKCGALSPTAKVFSL